MPNATKEALSTLWSALEGSPTWLDRLEITGRGDMLSAFAVTDLAAASVGSACLAMAEFIALCHGTKPEIQVDRRLASFWFGRSIRPRGWEMPAPWDAIAGDYQAADGWIKLHTNAPRHRAAALSVLGASEDREQVARAVSRWRAETLETAIVDQGGCAAAMRSMASWAEHPQGRAVAAEPILIREPGSVAPAPAWHPSRDRPLRGLRVLDMTRVLAGPVATRFLAGFGADVLRIDPPDWNEPGIVPDVTLGKRCARLNLRHPEDRAVWEGLLSKADVLVHGYRPGALDALGLDVARRAVLCPGLVDVSLDAYGWSGPWRSRRGFDSLVQMSSGIAEVGMSKFGREMPTPLPVQALDHATGYVMAAAAIRGLTTRLTGGAGTIVRTSLARTAALLIRLDTVVSDSLAPETSEDLADGLEITPWGSAVRLRPPCRIEGAAMRWDHPASELGSRPASW